MREYAVIPATILHDKNALHDWLVKAFDYVQALPPKTKKTPKKAASKEIGKKNRAK